MIRYYFIMLFLLVCVVQADINFKVIYKPGADGILNPMEIKEGIAVEYIISKDENERDFGDKDWIAVFKKGAPNNWKNIIDWRYITHSYGISTYFKAFKVGDYELRVYRNNSYIVEKSFDFSIVENDNIQPNLTLKQVAKDKVFLKSTKYYKAWIGIYKKGTTNEWKNVLAWSWVNPEDIVSQVDISKLPKGFYEARLFYNNSFKKEASVEFEKEYYLEVAPYIKVTELNSVDKYIIFENTTASRAWIGIYKKGTTNEWKNVLAWKWVNGITNKIDIKNLENGEYEARLFYNNSFDKEESVEFKIVQEQLNVKFGDDKQFLKFGDKLYFRLKMENIENASECRIGIYEKDSQKVKEMAYINFYIKDFDSSAETFKVLDDENLNKLEVGKEYSLTLFANDTNTVLDEITILIESPN